MIVLDELDREGHPIQLTDTSAAALAATQLVEARPEGAGTWRLLPRGYVGAVSVGDVMVQVVPKDKVRLSHLLFLLGYARDPGFRTDLVSGAEAPELWPALAETVAQHVQRALAHGVLQGYRTTEEALNTVRGRIRIGDQITARPGLMRPIEVTYDEYTHDIAENRLLRTALRRLLVLPRVPDRVRARLAHLDARLDGVSVLRRGARPTSIPITRINGRYEAALRLSELVVRNIAAEAGPGGLQVASFVVAMADVFEDFVCTALTEALRRRSGVGVAQFRTHLDKDGKVRMSVDLVHTVNGKPRLVFDAKYKLADSSAPNADLYQMLAYCTALEVPRAWLVYAAGGAAPRLRHIANTSITIVEHPLDLSVHPHHLLVQVQSLADDAWSMLGYASGQTRTAS